MLPDSYQRVLEQINKAILKSGHKSVQLVAVSKTKPVEAIGELLSLGQLDFGENYVQEFIDKQHQLPPQIRWHFIGHLQSRKVRDLIGHCFLIHSVDSLSLAREIDKRAAAKGTIQKILIQVDLAGEATKSGIPETDLIPIISQCALLPHIEIMGLMILPPFCDDPEKTRPYFRRLKKLLNEVNQKVALPKPLTELSMGMSHDYHVALEEGATIVRIGTALFGAR